MRILKLKAAHGWSSSQAARAFAVTEDTIVSWLKRVDEEGDHALIQLSEPVNKYPAYVGYLVRWLKSMCPTMGKLRIAQVLGGDGIEHALTLDTRSDVRRMGGSGMPMTNTPIMAVREFFAVVAASFMFAVIGAAQVQSGSEENPLVREPSDLEQSITVMSYNIHYGVGTDGVTDLARIAKVISLQDPDIVGLQEIGSRAVAMELGRLTNMAFVFGPSKETEDDYGDAILCKHPFQWVANYSIPSASSSRYQTMAIDVDLSQVFGNGATIRFINTHFDWLRTLGSQEARLAAVDVIERGFCTDSTLPSILTGDLNATPESAPLEKLIDKGWRYENLGKELFTIGSAERKRQIDYVLVRSGTVWQVLETLVLDEPIASDHLPILVKLRLLQK